MFVSFSRESKAKCIQRDAWLMAADVRWLHNPISRESNSLLLVQFLRGRLTAKGHLWCKRRVFVLLLKCFKMKLNKAVEKFHTLTRVIEIPVARLQDKTFQFCVGLSSLD